MRRLYRDNPDGGNISLLSLGFAIVAISVILVGAAATSVHLQRIRLAQLADETALDAADAMDVLVYYAGNAPEPEEDAGVALSEEAVRAVALEHLATEARVHGLEDVALVAVDVRDDHTVVVTVSAVVRPMFGIDALLPWSDGVTIAVTAAARAY